jgi:hypothetical protein
LKNKPLLVTMIMTMMVAGLFLTGGDVKKPKLSQVYDKLVDVYDLVMDNQSKLDELTDTLMSEPSVALRLRRPVRPRLGDRATTGTWKRVLSGLIRVLRTTKTAR